MANVGLVSYVAVNIWRAKPTILADVDTASEYPFLASRLFRENRNDIFINFMPLRDAVREYIQGQNEHISLYFEYLPSGSSVRVNDEQEIEMASLAKLPGVMAIYDKIARGELAKDATLTLEPKHVDNKYGEFWQQPIGTTISLTEAVKKTLVESDNTTYWMLYELLSHDDKINMFSQFDIGIAVTGNNLHSYITAKAYASILKSLYLATYNTVEFSNEILSLLSKSIFDEDIEAGVDTNVVVAHKTGNLERSDGVDVSNDCGIVYLPKRPYILCILITGEDEVKKSEQMEYLSKMIFRYMKEVNIEKPI